MNAASVALSTKKFRIMITNSSLVMWVGGMERTRCWIAE